MPIEASFIALFSSTSLTCETRYFAVSLVGRSMSSLSPAFFGLRQWMPFLTLTTCDTRQSDVLAISFSACSGATLRCSERNLTVCALACAHALLRSWSNPMVIQDFCVSIDRKSSGLPLMTSTVRLRSRSEEQKSELQSH